MKLIILTLFSCIALSSCFTYRNFDLESETLELHSKYKIKVDESKFHMGKITLLNDSILTLTRRQSLMSIPKKRIVEIKKRKFSLGKTIAASVVTRGIVFWWISSINIGL